MMKTNGNQTEERNGHKEPAGADFKALFNAMADPVLIVSKKGEIIEANKLATKVIGYSQKELVGMNVLE